ncbi:glycosyltransferase family 61 protein [Aphanothece sacrum]|uniref:Capsular polysaccharide biosynthesis protein-like protein n=1 Tax=Aphanothece sacrum FPU1 TaxID=1920663 RepID=A0A401IIP9_APHSA|nr:glycosyltransferase family 61 protein [Aphanothece sacrum]GBF81183.1 capsular polysaccharide biosynthesis protein-like protein [Aphanothece sacrum FPU1]GBF83468.1 capsular polysaccharide biosynthesis protein [Aphanothece sacrum FPU3]
MTFDSSHFQQEVDSQQQSELSINTNLKELAKKRGWLFEVITPPSIQISYPSNTIEEDILYVISHWSELLTHTSEELVKLGREEYFYHLHCVTNYEIGETFRCSIPRALVVNQTGLVITSDREIICQSIEGQKININLKARQIKDKFNDSEILSGTYISLLSYWSHSLNFAHWLMDCLPKLALIESLDSIAKKDLKFIIPDGSPHYIVDSLKLLSIQEEQTIQIQEESITVENLILCRAAEKAGRPQKMHFLAIRNKLLSSFIDEESVRLASTRIYVSRSQSSRKIVNEEEVLQILIKYNFQVIHCEKMSLAEQIRIFSEAEIVLGPHGAGIYNQFFCNSGTSIIEIYNKEYWHHSSRIISSFMGHKHWHIFGENVSSDWQTWVDPLKLEKVLSLVLHDINSKI